MHTHKLDRYLLYLNAQRWVIVAHSISLCKHFSIQQIEELHTKFQFWNGIERMIMCFFFLRECMPCVNHIAIYIRFDPWLGFIEQNIQANKFRARSKSMLSYWMFYFIHFCNVNRLIILLKSKNSVPLCFTLNLNPFNLST